MRRLASLEVALLLFSHVGPKHRALVAYRAARGKP